MMEASPVGSVSEFVGDEHPSRKMSKSVNPRWVFIFLECKEKERVESSREREWERGRGEVMFFLRG